ncbi:MAG: exodeoxyribonuclease VII small subunit, partial [Leptospirillum sp.]
SRKPSHGTDSFEKKMARLEEIVSLMEEGGLPLEKAIALFEEGVVLSKDCRGVLENTERRITLLMKGDLEVPFEDQMPVNKNEERENGG